MVDYPCIKPSRKNPWRKVHLYSVAGWFEQEVFEKGKLRMQAFGFGGVFKLDIDTNTLFGEVSDSYGLSLITGHMNSDRLGFTKQYTLHLTNRAMVGQPIEYLLVPKPDSNWVGAWEFGGSHHTAWCNTTLIHPDAFGIALSRAESVF